MFTQKTFRKQKKSRPFSILEVIICIAIIAMIGGLFAQKSNQLWKRHCFFKSVQKLTDELLLTRHFVQSMRADVDIKLMPTENGIVLYRFFEEPGMLRMRNTFSKKITIPNIFIDDAKLLRFFGYGHSEHPEEITLNGIKKIKIYLCSKSFGTKKIEK